MLKTEERMGEGKWWLWRKLKKTHKGLCMLSGKGGENKMQAALSHKTLERLKNSHVKRISED